MKLWKHAIAASALLVALSMGTAVAQEGPGRGNHHMAFMATALDLTDAQVAQIKQIHSAGREQMKQSHQQLRALHQQLHALVTSDNFDEAKAQTLISQIQQIQSTQMLEHAREMNATYKVLNPQQKAKFEKLSTEMHGHGGHNPPPTPAQE